MTEPTHTEKPPINWVPVIMFSSTTLLSLTLVPWYGFEYGYSLSAVVATLIITWMTGMAITGGYHRLWAHTTYDAHIILRVWYALWGAMALQNSILTWSSGHRTHHRYVDHVDKDPYSARRGLWFSHIGWMLRHYPSGKSDYSNVKDLMEDPIVVWQHKHYALIALSMNVLVPLALGLIGDNIAEMLLLAGIFRIVLAHHITFFINSIAHRWGSQPYTEDNTARDNAIFAFLTHGEGYHNYHHIFQNDYRNGVRWYQWDPTKWFIWLCSWVGLTSNLNVVSDFKIQRARLTMQFKRAKARLVEVSDNENSTWADIIEREYEQFKQHITELRALQTQRYQAARKTLQDRWDAMSSVSRRKELEYALRMQHTRMKLLLNQLHAAV